MTFSCCTVCKDFMQQLLTFLAVTYEYVPIDHEIGIVEFEHVYSQRMEFFSKVHEQIFLVRHVPVIIVELS